MSVFWITSVLILWIQCISLGKTEILCEPPPDIKRAIISPSGLTEYPLDTVLKYSCDVGFTTSQILPTTKCVVVEEGGDIEEAVWTDIELNCILACGPPPVIKRAIISPRGLKEYPIDTVLKYSCEFGFIASQVLPTTKCVEGEDPDTAVWTDIVLNCIPRSCGDPGSLNHGRVNGSLFSFPHYVAYICDEGYKLQGTTKRFCQTNGEWSGHQPLCIKVKCNEPEHPENGNVKYDSLEYGSALRYECKKGFRPDDRKERLCDSNGKWSGSIPNCVETYCDLPESPEHGTVRLAGGDVPKVDSVAFYQCNEDRTLIGARSTRCLETREWTFPPPTCAERCTVPAISNGHLIKYTGRYRTEKIPEGTEIEDVKRIYLRCDVKFKPNGQDVAELSISCNEGKWSVEPKCIEVSCKSRPPSVPNAYLQTKQTHHGVTLTYICYGNYYKAKYGAVTCVQGSWIGETPICKDSRCYINASSFPGIEPSRRGVFKTGTEITPQCREQYKKSERANGKMTCVNGEWQGAIPPCFGAGCNALPPTPNNGKIETYSGVHGSGVKYSCDYYFTLKNSSKPITCEFGTWKGEPPECKDSRCYLEDLPNKLGVDLTHSGSAVSGHLAEISCLKGYELKHDKPRCMDGKWQQRNGLSPCQESDCEVTNLENGKFEFAETSTRYCWSCVRHVTETIYKRVRSRSWQKSGNTLYIGCTKPSIFNGNDNREHVLVKCEKGQWNPPPRCLLPDQQLKASSTAPTQRTSQAPTPAPDLDESEKEAPGAEDSNDCLCTYNTEDKNLVAYAKNKVLEFGDRVKQNCTAYFQCRIFGFHRLVGAKELTCRDCSWHSSEFPSCVEPKIGDPVIEVISNEGNALSLTPAGTLLIRPNVDINVTCYFYGLVNAQETVVLKNPQNNLLAPSEWRSYGHNKYILTAYLYIRNVQPNSSGRYTCSRQWESNPYQVDIKIEDLSCPDIEETDGLVVAYGVQESHKVARFYCYDKTKVLLGPNTITCLSNGDWSANIPICKQVKECPELNETEGLNIHYVDGRKMNSTASFHCIEPYRRKGVGHVTCMANGEWTEAPPTCSLSTCVVESVFDVLPQTATVNLHNITAETLPEGTSLDIKCQGDNHHIIGDRVVTCMESGKWSVGNIQCVLGCGVMKSVNSTLIVQPEKEVYKFGDFATFTCPPGLELTSDVERVLCLQDGWSHDFPECQVSTCVVASVFDVLPQIATVNLYDTMAETLPQGTSLDVICQADNYHIIGDRVVTCMESGKWSVGSIQCVHGCGVMKRSKNSTLIVQPQKEVYKFGDFATFACPPGQELTSNVERVLCLLDGWSNDFPECQNIRIVR